jgi:hypothetical protein
MRRPPFWETCWLHDSNAQPPCASRSTRSANAFGPNGERLRRLLAAYSDLREKIAAHAKADTRGATRATPTAASGRRRATRVEEYAGEQAARFGRAYHTLRITGNDAVGEAAHQCTSALWVLADFAARVVRTSTTRGRQTAKQTRCALRQPMREDLGIAAPEAQSHRRWAS